MQYAHFDSTGKVIGWFDTAAVEYGDNLPPQDSLIEVPAEVWADRMSSAHQVLNGVISGVTVDPVPVAQDAAIARLRWGCGQTITGGFNSTALGTVHLYPSLAIDQQNLVASASIAGFSDSPTDWTVPLWCASAGVWSFADHTGAQVRAVARDLRAFVTTQQQHLADLSTQVRGATTVPAIDAIVWGAA